MYTNTGNVKHIAGLLFVTVAVTYCATHADEIVGGIVDISKSSARKVREVIDGDNRRLKVYEKYFNSR